MARPLVDSLVNEVVVTDDLATEITNHRPMTYRAALGERPAEGGRSGRGYVLRTRALFEADPAHPMPGDADWAGGTMLEDTQEVISSLPPEELFARVEAIGGDHGWVVSDALWRVRGLLDQLVGGIGLRRGRRHPYRLRVGDALDFWRVEELERPSLLRLRAEMLLPGEAWLEWTIAPLGSGSRMIQRARFHPRASATGTHHSLPFHRWSLLRMASKLGDPDEPSRS
ncbi:MAG: DUF2867 domain-containing protein [Microthrixaceae bacterium]